MARINAINLKSDAFKLRVQDAFKQIYKIPVNELGDPLYTDEGFVEHCIKNYIKDIVKAAKSQERAKALL